MSIANSPLSINEKTGDFTHVAVFDYTDIQDNATDANQAVIATIPAGGAVELCYVYEDVALAGTSDITLDVGTTTGDPDEFIDALDVDGLSAPAYNTGDAFTTAEGEANKLILAGATSTATDIVAEWNGTVANLTAGRVIIGLRILNPGRFTK